MKCPAVMLGYHNRPDVTPPITDDGFYVTGDVFRRDENGFYYFVGRTDDMFVSGGENIYPADVERMLERHPDVGAGRGVPIDDDIKGQKPVAFVVLKPGHRPRPRTRSSTSRSPMRRRIQHPRFVWFVDDLPLASTNKVSTARRCASLRRSSGGGSVLMGYRTFNPMASTTGFQRAYSSAMYCGPASGP